MKTTILIVLACTGICAGAGVPDLAGTPPSTPAMETCARMGVVIETDVQCSQACRLLVRSDESTVVDRGFVSQLEEAHELEGSFRFWTEGSGRVLYVYDDVQNLVCRVRNPESVTLVDVTQ